MAIIVALPAFVPAAVPVIVPLAAKAAASEVLQLRFGVICVFDESNTVALMVLLPVVSMNEVWFVFWIDREMETTGHVTNGTEGLVTP